MIVNADDYGLTAGVNRAIEEAHRDGIVTSTTALVSGAAFGEVDGLRDRCPALGVGLHLNLTLGVPESDPAAVRSLVDGDGRLLGREALYGRALRRRVEPDHVAREAAAQLRRLQAAGVVATHWDSHQDVAGLPVVARAAGAALWDGGVRRARTPRVWIVAPGRRPAVARWRWRAGHPRRWLGEGLRLRSTRLLQRRFTLPGWQAYAELVDAPLDLVARWRLVLETLPTGTCEIVAHPGHVDEELTRLSPGWAEARAVELDVLGGADARRRMAEAGVELITFGDLAGGASFPR